MNAGPIVRRALPVLIAALAAPLHAQGTEEDAAVLPDVVVTGAPETLDVEPAKFDAHASITTVDEAKLEREQPQSLFDAVDDVPGVSVAGGPRASGKRFVIRGYANNEDVLIKLDGAPKQFEKYRFGGTFIEPELLKSVTVERGPQIASGSGALGGTISAQTRDAADFLRPGERYGLQYRQAYGSNGDAQQYGLLAYGRPLDSLDLLAHTVRKHSDDIVDGNGDVVPLTGVRSESTLFKAGLFLGEAWTVKASLIELNDDTGRQPYDATGAEGGVGGEVVRSIRDSTQTLSIAYAPLDNPWLDTQLVIGRTQTDLVDEHLPGVSDFVPPGGSAFRDQYDYTNHSVDLTNWSRFRLGPVGARILTGLQWVRNERVVLRDGESVASLPNGNKTVSAAFIQPHLSWGRWTLIPGYRIDRYQVEATGTTREVLDAYGEPTRISLTRGTPSAGLVFDVVPERLSLAYNYAEAFRPPLFDEYFTQGAFSNCLSFFMPRLGPASNSCGALHDPQEAVNQEVVLSWRQPIAAIGGQMDFKFTHFWIDTDHLLESIREVSADEIAQPGAEKRRGNEIELSLRTARTYLSAAYSRMDGSVDPAGGILKPGDSAEDIARHPLYNAPANTLSLSAGWSISDDLELGIGHRMVASRLVTRQEAGHEVVHTHQAYRIWNASLNWALNDHLQMHLVGENLSNTRYHLPDGFGGGEGALAPGRNLQVKLTVRL